MEVERSRGPDGKGLASWRSVHDRPRRLRRPVNGSGRPHRVSTLLVRASAHPSIALLRTRAVEISCTPRILSIKEETMPHTVSEEPCTLEHRCHQRHRLTPTGATKVQPESPSRIGQLHHCKRELDARSVTSSARMLSSSCNHEPAPQHQRL